MSSQQFTGTRHQAEQSVVISVWRVNGPPQDQPWLPSKSEVSLGYMSTYLTERA